MFGKAFIDTYKENKKYFETGFNSLDKNIQGVPRGSIITVGARPAMGKTSFLISICNHLLDIGKKVLFCELDSSELIIERQFLQIKSQICRPHYSDEDWAKITEAIQFYNDKSFELLCKMNLSVEELEEKVKEEKPDILFIDCIQCIKMPKAPNLTEAINLAIQEIKRIAVENNLIVVMSSQISRSAEYRENHRPLLSDLRNGSFLEDLSDVVMTIFRAEYYDTSEDFLKNQVEIAIIKNKFGDIDVINLHFEKGVFSDCKTEDYIKAVFS